MLDEEEDVKETKVQKSEVTQWDHIATISTYGTSNCFLKKIKSWEDYSLK